MRMKHLLDTQVGGYDAMVPMCDIGTIGAGGGSLAWIDEGGMFRVGPESAGADPGPVCYGKGGTQPTVTDAIVVLGCYRPEALRESGLDIDPQKAADAIQKKIADPLGLGLKEAAAGIFRIAVNNMAEAIRLNSVARGFDPREFALVAYGGAGAAFAVDVAKALSMKTVIIPPSAGVGAASGLLATDMKYHRQATLWQTLDQPDYRQIQQVIEDLRGQAAARLQRDGFTEQSSEILFTADCRYQGQGYELNVAVSDGDIDEAWCKQVSSRFHQAHEQAYQRRFEDKPVMIVNLGATGVGKVAPLEYPEIGIRSSSNLKPDNRPVSFLSSKAVVEIETPFIHRNTLGAESTLAGPAVIEQSDTTTVLGPGTSLRVGQFGHLIVSLNEEIS